ncbi:hypothetical protein D7231_32105 [Streptomyces klenkii]|uniref:Uncharacterized protein n=1 Tax=Streptomyces klenkii TaxID=1420899 RepID=A0A3B0ARF7_9ACTN|nr:hypothetical protein D7231_32105 [Streptomyces klenkii]
MPDNQDGVVYALVPQLPGGLDVLVDDRPESCVIWVRQGMTLEEVMERLSRGCSELVAAHLWTRNPTPRLFAAAPAA